QPEHGIRASRGTVSSPKLPWRSAAGMVSSYRLTPLLILVQMRPACYCDPHADCDTFDMPSDLVPIKRALLSVSDKTGLAGFASALHKDFGVELISTGG